MLMDETNELKQLHLGGLKKKKLYFIQEKPTFYKRKSCPV